ncbi:MAG: Asp23/Gls24 family envelope stress response protein [Bacillota bacterium]
MASKKDNLPLSLARENDSTGTITYANEVIAIIAGVAANEVEGIAGMCSGGGFSDVFVRNRNIKKGVKVEIGAEEASVDLYVIVEYGTPIQIAALDVQDSVRKAIETMTGLHVVRVDVHVNGVSFEKEKLEEEAGLENAMLSDAQTPALEEKKEKAKPAADLRKKKTKADAETPEDVKPSEQGQDQPQEPEA